MNDDTKLIFDKLKYEVTRCHYYWILYRQLFGTNETRLEIINKTTPSFFVMYQDMFFDYITLELSKLTDPADFGKYKNLSFYYLLELLQGEISEEFNKMLKDILDELKSVTILFRNRRNKLVAHRDLETIGKKNEYGISRQSVEDALTVVGKYLNEIDSHFFNTTTMYKEFITDLKDDGTALLINLAKSLAYDDLVKQKKINSRFWEDYGKVF